MLHLSTNTTSSFSWIVILFLSDLTISTRHKDEAIGVKLTFNHDGKLVSKVPTARENGTTVTVQNLFQTLPVRLKEFSRNIKKEFSKLVQVLYAYSLVNTSVRFTIINQTEKNKRNLILSTNGKSDAREIISSIYGPKQVSKLCNSYLFF